VSRFADTATFMVGGRESISGFGMGKVLVAVPEVDGRALTERVLHDNNQGEAKMTVMEQGRCLEAGQGEVV
jgi:hypothetical protein